jgi:hypothetical protein
VKNENLIVQLEILFGHQTFPLGVPGRQMQRVAVIHHQGGAIFQLAGQTPQIGDTLGTDTTLGRILILVATLALPAGVHPIHGQLLGEVSEMAAADRAFIGISGMAFAGGSLQQFAADLVGAVDPTGIKTALRHR